MREASFDNGGSSIVDTSVEPAARFEVRGTSLTVRNLTWPPPVPRPSSSTRRCRAAARSRPAAPEHRAHPPGPEAELDQVDLGPARPYVPFDARVRGKVSGRVKVNGTFGETISLVIDGDASADRLTLGDDERRLATVQRAEMVGFRYQYPTSVRIKQITLRKPWLLFERNTDGSFELASLFVSRTPPTAPAPAAANRPAPAAPIRVLIGTLTLEDGFVRFVDRTTTPAFTEEASRRVGHRRGHRHAPSRHAKVALRATFASGTPLSIRGAVGGFMGPHFLDLTVEITEYPVPRLNPYMDHLLAWIAKDGTLTATLHYQLSGDDLQADNDAPPGARPPARRRRGGAVQQRVGLPLDTLVSVLKTGAATFT